MFQAVQCGRSEIQSMTGPRMILTMTLMLQSVQAFLANAVVPLSRSAIASTGPIMRVTGIESTPNPCSFKFTLDEIGDGSPRGITYTAGNAALAPEYVIPVLEIPGVESVYALGDWLCLNKVPSAKWESIVSFVGPC